MSKSFGIPEDGMCNGLRDDELNRCVRKQIGRIATPGPSVGHVEARRAMHMENDMGIVTSNEADNR